MRLFARRVARRLRADGRRIQPGVRDDRKREMNVRIQLLLLMSVLSTAASFAAQPDFSKVPGVVIDPTAPRRAASTSARPASSSCPTAATLPATTSSGLNRSTTATPSRGSSVRPTAARRGNCYPRSTAASGPACSDTRTPSISGARDANTATCASAARPTPAAPGPTADAKSGLLIQGTFHCAPVPVVVHDGRLWRLGRGDAGQALG